MGIWLQLSRCFFIIKEIAVLAVARAGTKEEEGNISGKFNICRKRGCADIRCDCAGFLAEKQGNTDGGIYQPGECALLSGVVPYIGIFQPL